MEHLRPFTKKERKDLLHIYHKNNAYFMLEFLLIKLLPNTIDTMRFKNIIKTHKNPALSSTAEVDLTIKPSLVFSMIFTPCVSSIEQDVGLLKWSF